MRTAWVEIGNIDDSPPELLRLVVSTGKTTVPDDALLNCLPDVLSVRSESFGRSSGWEKIQAEDRIERRFKTEKGEERVIYEEMGESIARHIW